MFVLKKVTSLGKKTRYRVCSQIKPSEIRGDLVKGCRSVVYQSGAAQTVGLRLKSSLASREQEGKGFPWKEGGRLVAFCRPETNPFGEGSNPHQLSQEQEFFFINKKTHLIWGHWVK